MWTVDHKIYFYLLEEHEDHGGGGGGGGGGGHHMMQIPIAPLPHGYHQGLGPNGESEDHDEEEEAHHEEKSHLQHQYDMDRGGPHEHEMLAADAGIFIYINN